MKKITGKEDIEKAISSLLVFTIIAGIEAGFLKDNMTSHGSILLRDSIFSFINLLWLYFAFLFGYFSYKEPNLAPKISYLLGAISFLLSESVINYLGFKWLYFLKLLILIIAIGGLTKYIRQTFQAYKVFLLDHKNTDNEPLQPTASSGG